MTIFGASVTVTVGAPRPRRWPAAGCRRPSRRCRRGRTWSACSDGVRRGARPGRLLLGMTACRPLPGGRRAGRPPVRSAAAPRRPAPGWRRLDDGQADAAPDPAEGAVRRHRRRSGGRRAGRRPAGRTAHWSTSPKNRQLTVRHGALPHRAMHSTSSRVNIAVAGGPAVGHAEALLGVLEQLVAAVEHAGDVGAHRHQVRADRLGERTCRRTWPCPAPRPAVSSEQLGRRAPWRPRSGSRPAPGRCAGSGSGRTAGLGIQRDEVARSLLVLRRQSGHPMAILADATPAVPNERRRPSGSPVDVAEDRVDGRDDGDGVGDQPAAQHGRQGLQVGEAGRPDVQPVGLGRPVGDEVAAQLAPGRSRRPRRPRPAAP